MKSIIIDDNFAKLSSICGGVLLGIKTRLMSHQVVTPPDVDLVMTAFTVTKRLSVLIGCCYRPPNTTEEYMHKVTAELRATQHRQQEAIYIGYLA